MTENQTIRRTQAQRREEAINRIIDAAIELIASRGTALLTMAEIGVHAGYSRGLPHKYFGTKEKVIEAVLESLIDKFNTRRKKTNSPEPGLGSIRSLIGTYFDRDELGWTYSKALMVMMAEATLTVSPFRESLVTYNRRNLEFLKKHLRIAKEKGEIQCDHEYEDLAIFIFGAFRGVMLQMLIDEELRSKSIRSAFPEMVEVLLKPTT